MDQRHVILIGDASTHVAGFHRQRRSWARTSLREYGVGQATLPRTAVDLAPFGGDLCTGLQKDFPKGMTCRLVIPAGWCLMHRVEPASARWSDEAAIFEYEQYVPVDLERLTCAVKRIDDSEALVVGVFTDAMHGLLEALQRGGIDVEAVFVDGLLVPSRANDASTGDASGTLLVDDCHLTVLTCSSSHEKAVPVRCMALARSSSGRLLEEHALTALATLPAGCNDWSLLTLADDEESEQLCAAVEAEGVRTQLMSKAESIETLLQAAAGAEDAVNLRRNELVYAGRWSTLRDRAIQCGLALAGLLLVLGIRYRVETIAYARGLDDLHPMRSQLYADAFPGETAPPEAALRLRSERIRLEGLTDTGEGKVPELRRSGLASLELLRSATEVIPVDLKIYVTEILADDRGLRLTGKTTSHAAAGELVQVLSRVEGLSADPPRTKLRNDGTVDFTITTKRSSEDKDE